MSFLLKHKGEISFFAALSGLIVTISIQEALPNYLPAILFIIQSGFEAGTVGGAADWLAVKMIFDEIKIGNVRIVPASGIIPRKQKAIAEGAGKLVATEWLSPASIQKALLQMNFAQALAEYIDKLKRSGELAKIIDAILRYAAEFLEKPATVEQIVEVVRAKLGQFQLSQALGKNLSEEQLRQILEQLIPFLADKAAAGLTSPDAFELIQSKLEDEQDGFFKKLLFDPVEMTEKTILKGTQFLRELSDDDSHPIRVKIIDRACSWLAELRSGSPNAVQLDELGRSVLESLGMDTWVKKIISIFVQNLNAQRDSESSMLYQNLESAASSLTEELKSDAELNARINDNVRTLVGELIDRNHHKIGELVEHNLNSLSPEQIKEQFKARTYDDMQWIRVNGAVAGFAIGIVIGVVRTLLR